MQRDSRIQADDIFLGSVSPRKALVPAPKTNDRLLILPQDVSGDSGAMPWWFGVLIIAGVLGIGYLVLKQEKIL
jgi:hypothetical protein